MRTAAELSSGKGDRDENFPVASRIIHPRHRGIILSFYRFARAADDIADHPSAGVEEKLALLDQMRVTLLGQSGTVPESVSLRAMLGARGLSLDHPLDLLEAFRRDVTKLRYRDWDDLIDYCRVSAMPVGRFVLDVHGESRGTWPANDALCAALQIINHLQDCAKDYRTLDRVYIPLDAFAARGLSVASLSDRQAVPPLRDAISALAQRTLGLLHQSRPFAERIADRRLALQVGVIQALAENLALRLTRRDPLSQRVHHHAIEAFALALRGALGVTGKRLGRNFRATQSGLHDSSA